MGFYRFCLSSGDVTRANFSTYYENVIKHKNKCLTLFFIFLWLFFFGFFFLCGVNVIYNRKLQPQITIKSSVELYRLLHSVFSLLLFMTLSKRDKKTLSKM